MFSSKKQEGTAGKNQETESNAYNIIGSGTQITGEIICSGDIRIDGKLKGNLTTKGKLVVGNTGIIEGDINCKNSDVSGKIDGKLVVSELLSLKATAKIHGDVVAAKLSIDAGAIFTGTCNMDVNGNSSTSSIEQRQDSKK